MEGTHGRGRGSRRVLTGRAVRGAHPGAVVAPLAPAVAASLAPGRTATGGGLGHPHATPLGTFAGIAYTQYDGLLEGRSSTGEYRVPYRITAPTHPRRGNRTVLVEPSHFAVGLGTLNAYLRRDYLFARGFSHAGIGWSTATFGKGLRILDPTVPGVFINGGIEEQGGRTDDEIIVDFARALAVDREARSMLGRVRHRYVVGFSDSAQPVLRVVRSGSAAGVFDLALPFTTQGIDPQAALAAGLFAGKIMIVNSEFDASASLVDRGQSPRQYRFYAVAGTPHIPDLFGPFIPSNRTTPASFQPALRAHFLQADRWVKRGTRPPSSTHLKTSLGDTLDRDANGNAISVDAGGPVPRLPIIEIGEARFISGFVGSYDGVKSIQDLGFASHHKYVKAFADKLADYVKAGYMSNEDATAMRERAALCPPLTFTETYRDHYDAFTAIVPCGG